MQNEVVISGFGGQGVLFAGQLLSYAAMDNGLNVTWYPSYGPEMRGGTANCTVIISDEEIGAPVVRNPMAAVVMNQPSFDKYEMDVKPGGVLVVNTSIIDRPLKRDDITVVKVPANELAESIGDRKLANMVMLGGLLANLQLMPLDDLKKALHDHLPARHHRLLPANMEAIDAGAKCEVVAAK